MAIFGALTIMVFYVFLRIFFDKLSSFLAALAFSLSLMHIHYSRTGFLSISASFFQVLSLLFIFYARKYKKITYIIFGAIFTGLGMYSYTPFIIFPPTIILLLIIDIFINKFSHFDIKKLLIFVVVFIAISIPLLNVIILQPNFYFSHS